MTIRKRHRVAVLVERLRNIWLVPGSDEATHDTGVSGQSEVGEPHRVRRSHKSSRLVRRSYHVVVRASSGFYKGIDIWSSVRSKYSDVILIRGQSKVLLGELVGGAIGIP